MSNTVITDLASIASFNRGPITAAFTLPASCLSTLTFNENNMYFGHGNTWYYDPLCYPTSRSTTNTFNSNGGNWNQYYYSPAQCPNAWYHATTFTSYFINAGDVAGQILLSLGADTTAVLCCPSGYAYFPSFGHQCSTTVNHAPSELVYFSPTNLGSVLAQGPPHTTTIISSDYMVWGDGMPVWWQSSDVAVFTAHPQTTTLSTSSTSTSLISPTSKNTPTSTNSLIISENTSRIATLVADTSTAAASSSRPSNLSTSAKIAIAVTIPSTLIAILLGTFVYFRRRGKKKIEQQKSIKESEVIYRYERGELATGGALSELENHHPRQRPYELPGHEIQL